MQSGAKSDRVPCFLELPARLAASLIGILDSTKGWIIFQRAITQEDFKLLLVVLLFVGVPQDHPRETRRGVPWLHAESRYFEANFLVGQIQGQTGELLRESRGWDEGRSRSKNWFRGVKDHGSNFSKRRPCGTSDNPSERSLRNLFQRSSTEADFLRDHSDEIRRKIARARFWRH